MKTPKAITQRSRWVEAATATAVAGAIAGLGLLGGFQSLDDAVYDHLMRFKAHSRPQASRVLLLELDDPGIVARDEALLEMIGQLQDLGAAQIVFTFLPPPTAQSFYRAMASTERVVLPLPISSAGEPGTVRPLRLPELELSGPILLGIVHAPPLTGGISRSQHSYFSSSDVLYPAIEVQSASQLVGDLGLTGGRPFLLSFLGGPGSLPNLTATRLLAGDVIESMVRDNVVLLGMPRKPTEPGIATPTTTQYEGMSLLEYQGHALNTLLAGEVIAPVSAPWRFGVVVAAGLGMLWLFQGLSMKLATWATGIAVASQLGATAGLFLLARIWLPVTEGSLTVSLLFLLAVRRRAMLVTASLHQLVVDSVIQLRERYWPVAIRGETTSWSLVANMINQTLDLNRLIFLEADSRDRSLKEILALHCTLDDIAESRRDYTRPPFVDAINAKGPIVVRGFLRGTDKSELQYLIPLRFYGEILGFWAIGMDPAKASAVPDLDHLLKDYTARISELLHQSKQPHGATLEGSHVSVEEHEATQRGLTSVLSMLQQRLGSLDSLVNSLSSGIIVFDIFGRVLQINEVMLTLLKKERLLPFEMTALDIIMALSDHDVSRARKLLRRVIVEHGSVCLPLTLRSLPSSRFIMHLRPLVAAASGDRKSGKETATRSILCELVETTSMALLYEMKSRLTERLCLQLRNDLAPIELSWSILERGRHDDRRRSAMAGVIHSSVATAVQRLGECQQFLSLHGDLDELERFPVDPKAPLSLAIEEVKATLVSGTLAFEVKEPNFISYVFGATAKLRELFKAMLLALCQDASENSTVLIRVTEGEDVVILDFSNAGFGIPNEMLQQSVFGDQPVASPEMQTIQSGAKWVQAWGGSLTAFSSVGVGLNFSVHLVKYI